MSFLQSTFSIVFLCDLAIFIKYKKQQKHIYLVLLLEFS